MVVNHKYPKTLSVDWISQLALFIGKYVIFSIKIIREITIEEGEGQMLKKISKIQTVEAGLRKDFGYDLFQRKNIQTAKYGVSDAEMTTILSRLQQQDKLADFGVAGLYQFIQWTYDLGFPLEEMAGPEEVTNFLYLDDNNGYYYGNDLLLYLGLSDQVSRMKTIASNNVSRKQFKKICNADLMVKPALTKVTVENKRFLQAVDTVLTPGMLSVEGYTAEDVVKRLAKYALSDRFSVEKAKEIIFSLSPKSIKILLVKGFYDEIFK